MRADIQQGIREGIRPTEEAGQGRRYRGSPGCGIRQLTAVEDEYLQAEFRCTLHSRRREDSHAKECCQVRTLDFSEHVTLSETLQAVSVKPAITRQKGKADHVCKQC